MSVVTEVQTVSENALEQLADRFGDLPRPVLAAVGASDLAVEQLFALGQGLLTLHSRSRPSDLRSFTVDLSAKAQQSATDYVEKVERAASEHAGRVQDAATELPGRVQHAVTDYAGKVQHAAAELPERTRNAVEHLPDGAQKLAGELGQAPHWAGELSVRAQQVAIQMAHSIQGCALGVRARAGEFVTELPATIAGISRGLSIDTAWRTVEAGAQLLGQTYDNLADRGDRTWSRLRSSSLKPGTVVDALPSSPAKAAKAAAHRVADAAPTSHRPGASVKVTTAAPDLARAGKSDTSSASAKASEAPAGTPSTPAASRPAAGTSTAKTAAARTPRAKAASAGKSAVSTSRAAAAKSAGSKRVGSTEAGPTAVRSRATRSKAAGSKAAGSTAAGSESAGSESAGTEAAGAAASGTATTLNGGTTAIG